MTLNRERLAYTLATHLCFGALQPDSIQMDVLIERWESYTPEKEQQRQDDLAEARAEFEAAQA